MRAFQEHLNFMMNQYQISLVVVLLVRFTITFSLLPPRNRATKMISNTIPPTMYIQGSIITVVSFVFTVVVVEELLEVLSWAHTNACVIVKRNRANEFLRVAMLKYFFMLLMLG